MNKGKKFVLCFVLIGCAVIVLWMGIHQRKTPIIEHKDFVVTANHQDYEIDGNKEITEITVKMKLGESDFEIALPEENGETWVIDKSVYDTYSGVKMDPVNIGFINTEVKNVMYTLNIPDRQLSSVSFKRTSSKNINFENIPYSYLLTVHFEYETNETIKNVFNDELFTLGEATHYQNDAYVEIPLNIEYEKQSLLKEESDYALEYELKTKLVYNQGHAYERTSELKTIGYQPTFLSIPINPENIKDIEKSIDHGNAFIEIELIATANPQEIFTCTKTIKHNH